MPVTTSATIDVGTLDFRRALTAVYPFRNRVKTGDAQAQHRVRLIFDAGNLYVAACTSNATGLARVPLIADSRGPSGKLGGDPGPLDPDDVPMVFDLMPHRVPWILQHFRPKAAGSDVDQMVRFLLDVGEDANLTPAGTAGADDEDRAAEAGETGRADRVLEMVDVGGLWTSGDAVRFLVAPPADAFPDVLALTRYAIDNAGASTTAKPLRLPADTAALFVTAGKAYDDHVHWSGVGDPTAPGWLAQVGRFLGTAESPPEGDDTRNRRQAELDRWRKLLPAGRKLRSA